MFDLVRLVMLGKFLTEKESHNKRYNRILCTRLHSFIINLAVILQDFSAKFILTMAKFCIHTSFDISSVYEFLQTAGSS